MTRVPLPQPDALIDKRGGVTTTFYKSLGSLHDGIDEVAASVAAMSFLTNQRDVLTISSPLNQDYQIEISSPFAYSITKVTTICTAGTCTLTFKIAGVALGGGANSVSTTKNIKTHSSANAVAVGNAVVATVSANAGCANLTAVIEYTRTS